MRLWIRFFKKKQLYTMNDIIDKDAWSGLSISIDEYNKTLGEIIAKTK